MHMRSPQHDLRSGVGPASGHSSNTSTDQPNSCVDTCSMNIAHHESADYGTQDDQQLSSDCHSLSTHGVGHDGTLIERSSSQTTRHDLVDVAPPASELPLGMPETQAQRTMQLDIRLSLQEAAPRARADKEYSERTPPRTTFPHAYKLAQIAEYGEPLATKRKPYPKSTSRYRTYGAVPSCCSLRCHGIPQSAAQDSTHVTRTTARTTTQLTRDGTTGDKHDDTEKGAPTFERVVLRITGLRCGCCEGGLSRVLDRIVAIRNHHVNVILGRVEFELDVNSLCVEDVIELLATRTGYDLEEHAPSNGQVLELIITDPMRLKHAAQPKGVLNFESPERAPWRPLNSLSRCNTCETILTETTAVTTDGPTKATKHQVSSVRITPTKVYYDPNKIGARAVFEHYRQYDPDLCLAPLTTDPGVRLGSKQTKQVLLWFLLALVLTIPVLVIAWAPMNLTQRASLHASLALATSVQIVAFTKFVPGALQSLYHAHILDMDFLIVLSTTVAYAFSLVTYVLEVRSTPLQTGFSFATSTLLVTSILLSRVVSELARFRAAKSVSFRSLQAEETLLVLPSANDTWASVKTTRIDSRLLQYGDIFVVPPYTKIVTDGIIMYGGSNVDESMITGEFKPKAKGLSSEVFAGTNNLDGSLVVSLRKLPHENSIQQIASLVEDAEMSKPKAQILADRLVSWFIPTTAIIGAAVCLSWLLVERLHFRHTWQTAALTAMTYAIATLVVSCPCAISLVVPIVVLIASGVAARYRIILRDPQALELARTVTDVVFDKTGTLTCGSLEVVGVPRYRNMDRARIKGLIMGLLKDIKHPVAAGIVSYLTQDRVANKDYAPLEVNNIVRFPGKGVQGTCAKTGMTVRAGNADWLRINVIGRESNTRCYFTMDGDLQASFELKDRTRPGADMVVEKLHARGVQVHMISGDTEGAVDDAASALPIHKNRTKSRCRPQEKCTYIKDLQDLGKVVMFAGDGRTDSVALRQADIGIHVGQGSNVAKSTADVILMTARLHGILILLDISEAAHRRIVTNFSWSGLYNMLAILLAAGVFAAAGRQMRITPQWAGLGELISVLPVVLVAFHMRWRDYGSAYRLIENDYQKVETPKREHLIWTRASSSTNSAECCEVPSS